MKALKVIIEDLREAFGIMLGLMYLMWLMSGFGLIPLAFGIAGRTDTGTELHILQRIFLISFCIAGWISTILMYVDHIKERIRKDDET